jgi:hypothetical protein
MKVLIIITKAGLCNRLQELLSYRMYGIQNSFDKIYFIWINTTHCNGNILDYINNNIDNVKIISKGNHNNDKFEQFILNNSLNKQCYGGEKLHLVYDEKNIYLHFHGGCGKHPLYKIIDPTIISFHHNILNEVNEYIKNNLGYDYVSFHLRQQDVSFYIDYDLLNNLIDKYNDRKIYIATDSINLQNKYKTISNIVVNENIHYSWDCNRSNIKDAIFDMLICSKSKIFCGTPNKNINNQSSYSNFIYGLRGVYEKSISEKLYNKHFVHIK